MDRKAELIEIEKTLSMSNISSRFTFIFFDVKFANKLPFETRALVKQKDGMLDFAVWLGDNGWCEEGSYCTCGGIGGDITNNVLEFALNGVN